MEASDMAMTDWTIITRSLAVRRLSSTITVVSVAVAVGLLLTLLTMAESGRKSFERGTGNMHLLVFRDPSPLTGVLNSLYYAGIPRASITWKKFEEIAVFGPSDVPPGMTPGFAIPTQIGDSFKGLPVVATTIDFFTRFEPVPGAPWKLRKGEFFDADLEVVVGSAAAVQGALNVGDSLLFTHGSSDSRGSGGHVHDEFAFKVVGILEPTGSAHDRALFINLQSSWLMHALDRLEASGNHAHGTLKDNGLPVAPEDLTDADRLITGIFLRIPTRAGSDASAGLPQVFDNLRRDTSITVASPRQELDRLFAIVGTFDVILLGMALVVLVGSGLSITLALYNSMDQRRRQIAILRVLGCSQFRVFGLILTEAAIIGLLGALAGVVLALVGGGIVAAVMRSSYGVHITPALPPDLTLGVVMGAVLLAALAGLLPALLAYRTPVANNLKPVG
jgi:putative ABC transport system permease protein